MPGEPPPVRGHLAENPEPRHAPIRIDVESQVGRPPGLALNRKAVLRVPFERRAGEDLDPRRVRQLLGRGIALDGAGFERAGFRIVAAEIGGVHDHAPERPRQAEPDDAPVVAGLAAAAGLPAVHPLADVSVFPLLPDGLSGLEEVLLGREEFVIRGQHRATQTLGCEVHEIGKIASLHPGGGACPGDHRRLSLVHR